MSTSATCPRCREQVLPGDRFCTQCGAEVLAAQGDADTARISADRVRRNAGADTLLGALQKATLGEYEILRQIGSGGMARVFLAHDIALDRKVAIKVLLPGLATTPGTVERFKREARTAASLSHPHIIPIYVVRETDDLLYFVMQFVEGRSLDGILGDLGKLPIDVAVAVLSQVSGALHFAHRQGVIHRDVKPGNILIDDEGWAVVTDFGIAKVREAAGLTLTGSTIGTPAYMSPEQCSAAPVTGASDQYSLGVVGYEMLTGVPPFGEGTVTDIMRAHVERPPPSLAALRPDCPPKIAAVLERMLEKTPGNRYPSVGAVAEALGAPPVSGEAGVRSAMIEMARSGGYKRPESVTPSSPVPPAKHRPSTTEVVKAATMSRVAAADRRRRRAVPVGAMVAVLGLSGIIWAATRNRETGDAISQPVSVVQPNGGVPAVPLSVVGPESIVVGESDRLRALGGPTEEVSVRWQSADPGFVAVDSSGRIVGVSAGIARVWLYRGTDSVAHRLQVVPGVQERPAELPVEDSTPAIVTPEDPVPVVTALAVTPAQTRLEVGQTVMLDVIASGADGRAVTPDRVQWFSADQNVALVSSTGVVTARQVGTTRIQVRADGVDSEATVTVTPIAVARVVLDRPSVVLTVGDSVSLFASPQSADGAALAGRQIAWSSGDPAVATVSSSGVVTARGDGRTRIEVQVEGATAFSLVTVTEPDDPAPPPPPEDPEPRIRAVVDQYTTAIQAGSLAALRAVYPGMTDDQARTWRLFFESVTDLRVETDILDLTVAEGSASVRVRQVLTFRSTRRDRQESEFVATIERGPTGWHIARIN